MNIESLARLIESVDHSVFRSLVAIFLPLIGLKDADYCDGPHDGGKDFNLIKMPGSGIEVGIQISTDAKWKKKINSDAAKLKNNFNTNLMYFISSKRIPEGSFEKEKEEIIKTHGVVVTKYDNQSISKRFIDHNKVIDALIVMGININTPENLGAKYLDPKNEAIASLLLFDEDSRDLRERFFQSIIKSCLSRELNCTRENLIQSVIERYQFEKSQSVKLSSSIDRLLQKGELISKDSVLSLSESEFKRYEGLKNSTELELQILREDFNEKIESMSSNFDDSTKALLLENFLDLTIDLAGKDYNTYDKSTNKNSAYLSIRRIISEKFGDEKSFDIFSELSRFFAEKDFTKHIACSKLYEAFLNTKSSHLINALGGTENLSVYIDASVFIPIICGLLYEPANNRFSTSGSALYQLISSHRFNAILPHDYLEEVASHLIEACRDYKHIIESDIDLSYSGNAFVSHFSTLKKNGNELSFEEYVKIFGIRLNIVSNEMSDSTFWNIRDRAATEIAKLSSKYGFSVERFNVEYLATKIENLKEFLDSKNINRPEVLIKHDAKVIAYLSGDYVPSGTVKVLCTWDKIHSIKNPDGDDGYYVMHPISIIDYMSLAKSSGDSMGVSHLLDFSAMQAEKDLELSAKIWDAIAKVENDNLSDANILNRAKEFQKKYIQEHANDEGVVNKVVEEAWMAWKP